jgi:hypothetical protein
MRSLKFESKRQSVSKNLDADTCRFASCAQLPPNRHTRPCMWSALLSLLNRALVRDCTRSFQSLASHSISVTSSLSTGHFAYNIFGYIRLNIASAGHVFEHHSIGIVSHNRNQRTIVVSHCMRLNTGHRKSGNLHTTTRVGRVLRVHEYHHDRVEL